MMDKQFIYLSRHGDTLHLVSSNLESPHIHYVAPPSASMTTEMDRFIIWFNESRETLPALLRAGIAHAWFELIHPFEDGNGRIGRALIEKCLAQATGQPTLLAVSQTIQRGKQTYYDALRINNTSNNLTEWLLYFCDMVLESQRFTIESIEFVIKKTRFFDTFGEQLNSRQLKMVQRILAEKLDGFRGGVSVKNYVSVTKASPATANRDLNDMVAKSILRRDGDYKSTRYWFIGLDSAENPQTPS